MMKMWKWTGGVCLVLLGSLGSAACGDDAASESSTSAATGTGGGDAGSGGSATGAGGSGGSGGEAPATCLDAAAYAAWFTMEDPTLCVVAMHDAELNLGYDETANYYQRVPTWGRHGGPLTMTPKSDGSADIVRFMVPADPLGALSPSATPLDAGFPLDGYPGAQVIDLPFFDWTAVSWTGAFPVTQGELLVTSSDGVAATYGVNGIYSGSSVAATGGDAGRLLYSGLSALDDEASSANGLYAADACNEASGFASAGDPGCSAPALVASWGDSAGPVAVDSAGNAFAVLASFSGDQEARGFAAKSIAKGSGPTEGDVVFTLPGFGSALAAMAPSASAEGRLVFQPIAAEDPYDALDVVAQRYAATETAVVPQGAPATLLSLAQPNIVFALMSDDQGRLWVGAPRADGGATFLVIAPAP